jgi:hypothetical protein
LFAHSFIFSWFADCLFSRLLNESFAYLSKKKPSSNNLCHSAIWIVEHLPTRMRLVELLASADFHKHSNIMGLTQLNLFFLFLLVILIFGTRSG